MKKTGGLNSVPSSGPRNRVHAVSIGTFTLLTGILPGYQQTTANPIDMNLLPLDSLEIRNFRCFRHLVIQRLGQVNLVVGKNNVGKTALLEALRLYASRSFTMLEDILSERTERAFEEYRQRQPQDQAKWPPSLSHLFFGRPRPKSTPPLERKSDLASFSIGALQASRLEVRFGWVAPGTDLGAHPTTPSQVYQINQCDGEDEEVMRLPAHQDMVVHRFIRASGLPPQEVNTLWDEVALTAKEDVVMSFMRLLVPDIERMTLVGKVNHYERIPIVKRAASMDPEPLGSLGEGLNRMWGLAVATVKAQDGLLLIDEVESGLHYSAQPAMWRLVFEMAARLNVQVFATTHSLDCIRAFQQAASAHQAEGLLISLRRKRDAPEEVVAVLADEEDLAYVVQSGVEVR